MKAQNRSEAARSTRHGSLPLRGPQDPRHDRRRHPPPRLPPCSHPSCFLRRAPTSRSRRPAGAGTGTELRNSFADATVLNTTRRNPTSSPRAQGRTRADAAVSRLDAIHARVVRGTPEGTAPPVTDEIAAGPPSSFLDARGNDPARAKRGSHWPKPKKAESEFSLQEMSGKGEQSPLLRSKTVVELKLLSNPTQSRRQKNQT